MALGPSGSGGSALGEEGCSCSLSLAATQNSSGSGNPFASALWLPKQRLNVEGPFLSPVGTSESSKLRFPALLVVHGSSAHLQEAL